MSFSADCDTGHSALLEGNCNHPGAGPSTRGSTRGTPKPSDRLSEGPVLSSLVRVESGPLVVKKPYRWDSGTSDDRDEHMKSASSIELPSPTRRADRSGSPGVHRPAN